MRNLRGRAGICSAHDGGEGTIVLTCGTATSLVPAGASDRHSIASLASDGPCRGLVRVRNAGWSAIICHAATGNAVSLVPGVARASEATNSVSARRVDITIVGSRRTLVYVDARWRVPHTIDAGRDARSRVASSTGKRMCCPTHGVGTTPICRRNVGCVEVRRAWIWVARH